ncbi:MAG: YihY/virulence factor BrkB family protein [Chloroflexi bacterium]|nr:YihY/virulence factor BrkB family protein [Chloroflexota bacterium]
MPTKLPKSISVQHLAADIARRTRPWRDRLKQRFLVALMLRTMREMSDDDATHMAAGVAYYALFSLFPLLLGLIAVLSLFLEPQEIQSRLTDFSSDYLPASDQLIDSNLDAVLKVRGALGVFAVVGLLWSGSAIFGAISRAVNRAWDVHIDRPFFISKPRQLGMALGVGVLFLGSLSIVAVVRATGRLTELDVPGIGPVVDWLVPVLLQGSSFAMTVMMFLLVYKFMPNTRTYWQYIWPGAMVAAVLFELAKNMFVLYLSEFASFQNVYGTLTPVIVLLLWAYVSSLILIFGAELSSEYGRLRRGVGRGVLLHPREASPGDESDE